MQIDLTGLVFVDTETTGLNTWEHRVLETCYIRGHEEPLVLYPIQASWGHNLAGADPKALEINKWFERFPEPPISSTPAWLDFYESCSNMTLVGANIRYDAEMLRREFQITLGNQYRFEPWHYRLLDIEAWAAGVLHLPKPIGLSALRQRVADLGYSITEPDHTAEADAKAVRDIYVALRDYTERTG